MAIGGNYTVGVGGPMRGVARVWQAEGAGGPAVELDLQQLPIRLWAAEIAVLRHTASEMATEKIRRCFHDPILPGSIALLLRGQHLN